MVASVALVEVGESLLARLARHMRQASRARRCGRSCSWPRRIAARPAHRPAAGSPAASRSSATLRMARRPALAASGEKPSCGGEAGVRLGERRRQMATEIALQSGARGEDHVGIDILADLARNIDLGRQRAAPGRRGSDRPRPPRRGAAASRKRRRRPGGRPPRAASMRAKIERSARLCAACQRLKGSLSCASRRSRSSADCGGASRTGAEKSRSSDTTGRDGTFSKTMRARARRQFDDAARAFLRAGAALAGEAASVSSSPFSPMRPSASGMTKGFLSLWPGRRRRRLLERSSVSVLAPAS